MLHSVNPVASAIHGPGNINRQSRKGLAVFRAKAMSDYFNFGGEDRRPPVTIRTRRPMILRPLDGEARHTEAGSTVIVSAATLDQLDAADFELI